jgi:hypothetical protein
LNYFQELAKKTEGDEDDEEEDEVEEGREEQEYDEEDQEEVGNNPSLMRRVLL